MQKKSVNVPEDPQLKLLVSNLLPAPSLPAKITRTKLSKYLTNLGKTFFSTCDGKSKEVEVEVKDKVEDEI